MGTEVDYSKSEKKAIFILLCIPLKDEKLVGDHKNVIFAYTQSTNAHIQICASAQSDQHFHFLV